MMTVGLLVSQSVSLLVGWFINTTLLPALFHEALMALFSRFANKRKSEEKIFVSCSSFRYEFDRYFEKRCKHFDSDLSAISVNSEQRDYQEKSVHA